MSSILDSPEGMSEIDKGRMIEQIMGFPEHLSSALCSEIDVQFSGDTICLCGMGGSAISGDILADYVARESDFLMSVLRGTELPRWVGDDALLVAVSYSGNTKEVLRVFDQALKKDLNTVAVTSGGRLMEICEENGIPVTKVPGGFQPRAALGFLLGSTARVLESAGVIPAATELGGMIETLKRIQDTISSDEPTERNVAKRVAIGLEDTVPVIYATSEMRSAAMRWHTQINENSKMMAFTGEVPECNHNHIVGWMEGRMETRCHPVFLRSGTDDPEMADIMSITIEVLEEGGKSPIVLDFDEGSSLHNLMAAIMVGDFVSFYLAMLNGVDPLPVESIQDLKSRMA